MNPSQSDSEQMETQQQSQTCWVSAAALMLRQLHERTHSARIKEHLPLDCPLVSQTQACFPHMLFSHSTFTRSHLYPEREAPRSRPGYRPCLGYCYSVFIGSTAGVTFRRSPPEQYSMARRGTSLTRKFISSGTSQALTTLGWFSLSTRRAG